MAIKDAPLIKRLIERNKRVLIHGLPGLGKTTLALEMSKHFKVCVHFDCRQDNKYFLDLYEAYNKGINTFSELLVDYGDVNPFLIDSVVYVFDNIDSSDYFVEKIFPIFNEYNLKVLMTASVRKQSMKMIIDNSFLFTLRPLSLFEFLTDDSEEFQGEIVAGHLELGKPIPTIIHENCMRIFEDYLVTGGIPEAYNAYLNNENAEEKIKHVHEIHRYYSLEKILDISELSEGEKLRCRQVVDSVYEHMLIGDYSKFIVSRIREGASFALYKTAIDFLTENNYLLKVEDRSKKHCYKLFFYDCGIVFDNLLQLSNKSYYANFSGITKIAYENYLIQELYNKNVPLGYWKSKYTASVDAMLEIGINTIAIKSFYDDDLRDKSLLEFEKEHQDSTLVKISRDNFKKSEKFFYLPVYAISCVETRNFEKVFLNIVK